MNKEVPDRYIIKSKIGQGSFGDVFIGRDIKNNSDIAVKIEHNDKKNVLKYEYAVYNDLMEGKYPPLIPKVHWFGQGNNGQPTMIMDCLGESLEKLHIKCGGKFGLKTTLMLGIQMFDLIKSLHDNCYIHRDIKPDNFLMGSKDNDTVYLIDFGLAKRFKNKQCVHIKKTTDRHLIGTAR